MKKILLALGFFLLLAEYGFAAEPCITHQFVSEKSDSADTTLIRPSDWNSCHSEPPKLVMFGFGCTKTACAVLEDADDYVNIIYNYSERTWTISEVICRSNAGTPSINLLRDDGTPTAILSSNLSCSTSGATSSSFTSGENVIAPGHWIGFSTISAGGTAKRVDVGIKYSTSP